MPSIDPLLAAVPPAAPVLERETAPPRQEPAARTVEVEAPEQRDAPVANKAPAARQSPKVPVVEREEPRAPREPVPGDRARTSQPSPPAPGPPTVESDGPAVLDVPQAVVVVDEPPVAPAPEPPPRRAEPPAARAAPVTPVAVPAPADQPVTAPEPPPITRAVPVVVPAAVPIVAAEPLSPEPLAERAPVTVARPSMRVRWRARRPRVRKVSRVVRRVDAWSVFKIAVILFAVAYVVLLVAGVLLWNLAHTTGTVENVEGFIRDLFGLETFTFDGEQIFRASWVIGLFLAIGGTGFTVTLAVMFNLVADLVGGVRITVLEEEVVLRERPVGAPTVATRRRERPKPEAP